MTTILHMNNVLVPDAIKTLVRDKIEKHLSIHATVLRVDISLHNENGNADNSVGCNVSIRFLRGTIIVSKRADTAEKAAIQCIDAVRTALRRKKMNRLRARRFTITKN